MINPTCPQCQQRIPGEDINVGKDIAYCRVCNLGHSFAALVQGEPVEEAVDFQRPPPGVWFHRSPLNTVIGASHRSLGAALGLLAISLFWNGIVSVFVALALSSTLHLLGVAVPEWFPAPKMNQSDMGWGMTIFLWLFLTPFMLIGLGMILGFLSCLGGRTEVRITPTGGTLFGGIGPVGRRRRFTPHDVKSVTVDRSISHGRRRQQTRQSQIVITLQDGSTLKLGSGLEERRLRFMAAALRTVLSR